MNYDERYRTIRHIEQVKNICDNLNYQETRKHFSSMAYVEKLKAIAENLDCIAENLDHVLSVCAKEDRIDDIRKAADQYEV